MKINHFEVIVLFRAPQSELPLTQKKFPPLLKKCSGEKHMRPIFTIHAGEFVFGEYIAREFSALDLWIPAKDKGIDLLVTNHKHQDRVGVQVKMSRDYASTYQDDAVGLKILAGGWFTFRHKKIKESKADIWSLILISREAKPTFINIPPQELLEALVKTHGHQDTYNLYPSIVGKDKNSKDDICVECRGLSKQDKGSIYLASHIWLDDPAKLG